MSGYDIKQMLQTMDAKRWGGVLIGSIYYALKKLEKTSEITEDDLTIYTKDMDKVLQLKIDFVDKEFKDKEKEIMEI